MYYRTGRRKQDSRQCDRKKSMPGVQQHEPHLDNKTRVTVVLVSHIATVNVPNVREKTA